MRKITKINEISQQHNESKKLRVAAYCRVSTNSDSQLESLETQKMHYQNYINSRDENINTGSMESELMLSILSSMAESESTSISENSTWSTQKRFQNGTYIISSPPFGYENINGEMVVIPEQATWI